MRDAARAAEMSDPDQNRWFRRRWVDDGRRPEPVADALAASAPLSFWGIPASSDIDDTIDLELVGRELLAAWRRERAQAGGRRDV